MRSEPLADLGDRALVWLGDGMMRRGPEEPHARAPRLVDWLAGEACREQARRRGETVGDPAPLNLLTFAEEELVASGEFTMMFTVACRQTGYDLFGHDEAGEQACLELIALGETLSEAIAGTLAVMVPAGMVH